VAAKTEAAVSYAERDVEFADDAVERMRNKVAAYEQRLAEVRDQLTAAEAEAEASRERLDQAKRLYVTAARFGGRPDAVLPSIDAAAAAETATPGNGG